MTTDERATKVMIKETMDLGRGAPCKEGRVGSKNELTGKDCVCGSEHSRKETLHDTMSIFKVKGRNNFKAAKSSKDCVCDVVRRLLTRGLNCSENVFFL